MKFHLAASFQSSLEKLNGEEQKAAKLATCELQINPANPGLQCHRFESNLLLCSVGHGAGDRQQGRPTDSRPCR